jgi:hypothetical protein
MVCRRIVQEQVPALQIIQHLSAPLQRSIFICSLYDCPEFLSPFYAEWIGLRPLRGDMNKLDVSPPAFTLSPASFPDLRPARRLVVLVPEPLADSAIVAGKLWELAKSLGGSVQLIGLCKDAALESSLRRQLVFLSAMVCDGFVSVQSKIEFGSNWLKVVKDNWQEGDILVCFTGQYTGLTRKPLSQMIKSNLNLNVYTLEGFSPADRPRQNRLSSAMAWVGSLSIIAVFFWMQARIIQLPEIWAQNALMYLSLPVEAGLIWIWNAIFS